MATLSLKGGIPDELKSSAGAYLKMPSVQVELEEAVNLVDVHQFMSGIILSEQDGMFDSITSVYGINITDIHSMFDVLVKDLSMLISEPEGLLDTVNPSFGFTIEDTLEVLDGYTSGNFPGIGNYPGAETYPGVGFVSLVVAAASSTLSDMTVLSDNQSNVIVAFLSDSVGLLDSMYFSFPVEILDAISLTDLLDAVLTIGRQHIHVDKIILKIGQYLINMSVKDMTIDVGVESYKLDDIVDSINLDINIESVQTVADVDEAITERE